jgi:hypothetical protein
MNSTFAEHVTNTAFFLSISKKQIVYLEILHKTPFPHPEYYHHGLGKGRGCPDSWIASYGALIRKGLVQRVIDNPIKEYGHYELTEAGRLTCLLLVQAGLIIEQTEARNEETLHRVQG